MLQSRSPSEKHISQHRGFIKRIRREETEMPRIDTEYRHFRIAGIFRSMEECAVAPYADYGIGRSRQGLDKGTPAYIYTRLIEIPSEPSLYINLESTAAKHLHKFREIPEVSILTGITEKKKFAKNQ